MKAKYNLIRNDLFRSLLVATCAISLAACAAARHPDSSGVVQSGTLEEATVEAVATVEKVDTSTRDITVKMADGSSNVINAGPDVVNFDQIDAGDQIRVVYYESVAYDVKVPGAATPGVTMTGGAERAAAGQKPGTMGARVITVTATIDKIARDPDSVTLRGADGKTRIVQVRNPKNLEKLKVGDLVEITLSQAMAVVVEETK